MRITKVRSAILLVVIGVLLYTTALALQWDAKGTLLAGLTGAILALIGSRYYQAITVTPFQVNNFYLSCRDRYTLKKVILKLGKEFHNGEVITDTPYMYKYMVYWKEGKEDLLKTLKRIS